MWAPIWPGVADDRAAGRARSPTASTCRRGCPREHGARCSTTHLGAGLARAPRRPGAVGRACSTIPDEELWAVRQALRDYLFAFIRERARAALDATSTSARRASSRPARCSIPNALTIGFARRFTGYKRPELIFHDPERLRAHPQRAAAARCRSSSPARRIRPTRPASTTCSRSTAARSIRCSAAASPSSTTTTCTSRTSSCRAATSG